MCYYVIKKGVRCMATVFDVAEWFLSKEAMTPKKVQKLCYYYKAWGLALYDTDFLPDAVFQAWVHGPVCPELYRRYKEYGWNDIPKYMGALYKFSDIPHDTGSHNLILSVLH